MRKKINPTRDIAFASLGEYRMHFHAWHEETGLGAERPFNCSIRNREELYRERVELHLNEELHFGAVCEEGHPLLRYNEYGLWVFNLNQENWWPLRHEEVRLDLDRLNRVRLRFYEI